MTAVWKVSLAREAPRLAVHRSRLDAEERQRAARFFREADRLRYVIARSTRKEILGRLLDVEPSRLAFEEGRFGKPRLVNAETHRLHFNSSHSGDWILHAFDSDELGVDVELIRPEMAVFDDFAWVLSPEERRFLLAAAPAARASAMATVWVRKEAYVKALGAGLQRELTEIAVVDDGNGRPRLAFDRGSGEDARAWVFDDIEVDASHKACLVRCAPRHAVVLHEYGEADQASPEAARPGPADTEALRAVISPLGAVDPTMASSVPQGTR